MKIVYRTGNNISSKNLDILFKSIKWDSRGDKKWKEVLSKSYFVYSAWEGNTLVGLGRIVEDGVMCMLYDIVVHSEYQGQGIGSKILKKLISKVKNKNYASIRLFVWEGNPANIPFYEKHGFVWKKTAMELKR
jgi:ribosomal protein S18 acetylase RimI-like enzyme